MSGLTELPIRRKLLSIKDLTWDMAQQEALSWEAAQHDAQYGVRPEAKSETVNQVSHVNKSRYQQSPIVSQVRVVDVLVTTQKTDALTKGTDATTVTGMGILVELVVLRKMAKQRLINQRTGIKIRKQKHT